MMLGSNEITDDGDRRLVTTYDFVDSFEEQT
jgi:hypothetical protein